ncbi:MAG: DNA polymerase III subunit gamma/tau [Pseudomonadales bacterium]
MTYQVLARKLRPATFDALVGQEHVVRALRNALDTGRLHHAYLFTGTRGVGKTTIARVLAKCLNCERGVSSTPCGECAICREVAENRFVDLIEVDAASRTRVDDTRELLENAQYLPSRGRYKVYLIDEVHMLTTHSFNALLKTLEEPPEHVKFLLATTEVRKVPITVLSRCLQFQLKNLPAERIADYLARVLAEEGIDADAQSLATIAAAARGSMRDALSITDQAIAFGEGALRAADVADMLGLVGRDQLGAVVDALARGDAAGILAVTAELAEQAVDFSEVLAELIGAFHRMAVEQAVSGGGDGAAFAPETVQLYYQIALLGYRDLQFAPDPRSAVEMTLLRMLAFAPDGEGGPPSGGGRDKPAAERAAAPRTRGAAAVSSAPALPPQEKTAPPQAASHNAAPQAVAPAAAAPSCAWHEVVSELELSGVARMIAEHSELVDDAGDVYRLRLDAAHDTLLSDAPVATLERALARRGRTVRVEVEIGAPTAETPAQRFARLRAERQRAAEQTLAGDQTVRSLLNEFGGRLEGVSPIE